MNIDEQRIRTIVEEVVKGFGQTNSTPAASPQPSAPSSLVSFSPSGRAGVFAAIDEAVAAAKTAQLALMEISMDGRRAIIENMRRLGFERAEEFSKATFEETGIGRAEDKVVKHNVAAEKTPGIEDLTTKAWSGDGGLTIEEMAPYGVIGSVTPATHPVPTMLNNAISMIAAGNAVVFNGHPAAKKVFASAIKALNGYITEAGGPPNLVTCVPEPTIETGQALFDHRDVKLISVTGGSGVVKAALKSGKKVVAAGPGNPPVVVDETADLDRAAESIIEGATFDNNILCIAEKECLVVASVADALIAKFKERGAVLLTSQQIEALSKHVFQDQGGGHPILNRDIVGREATHLAGLIGLSVPPETRLLFGETDFNHVFVQGEQMTPFLPVVQCPDVNTAIDMAIKADHGFRHTAIMHSTNIIHMDRMARLCDCTVFVKNGPSTAGLGIGGEGTTTFSIAGPTGEGITTARTFTRVRRCALSGSFRII